MELETCGLGKTVPRKGWKRRWKGADQTKASSAVKASGVIRAILQFEPQAMRKVLYIVAMPC